MRDLKRLSLLLPLFVFIGGGCVTSTGRTDVTGVPNFGSVSLKDNKAPVNIFRGAQPTPDGMKVLSREYGIRAVINLRTEENLIARERKIVESEINPMTGKPLVEYISIPSRWQEPETVKVIRFLTEVRRLIKEGKPIYVHCQFGRDRTGLYVAMYRMVEQGWTLQQALKELSSYGHNSLFCPDIDRYLKTANAATIRAALATAPRSRRCSSALTSYSD